MATIHHAPSLKNGVNDNAFRGCFGCANLLRLLCQNDQLLRQKCSLIHGIGSHQ